MIANVVLKNLINNLIKMTLSHFKFLNDKILKEYETNCS